jgi:hypothetical protein
MIMTTIDFNYMKAATHSAIKHASNIIDPTHWAITPTDIKLDTHKTKFGQVNAQGVIFLAQAFIGTQSTTKLEATILHEIAHCIVGLHQHHNKTFKRVNHAIASHLSVPQTEIDSVINNVGYPLRLVAYPVNNGAPIDMGGAFKRTKKYVEYRITSKRCFSCHGQHIERFDYLPFHSDIV